MSYLVLGVPLLSIFWSLYWLVVRPARKQRRAALAPRLPEGFVPPSAALTPPEPKAPRDTSRTYPRPGRTRSKLTRICPVCGMEDPGNLDGKVLGWPAHRSCAEWLGDWRPARTSAVAGGEYATEPVWCQSGTTNTIVYTGKSPVTALGGGGGAGGSSLNMVPWMAPGVMAVMEQVGNGLITPNEARERLDREISAAFGMPSPDLGDLEGR
jgi:hypothetical protein